MKTTRSFERIILACVLSACAGDLSDTTDFDSEEPYAVADQESSALSEPTLGAARLSLRDFGLQPIQTSHIDPYRYEPEAGPIRDRWLSLGGRQSFLGLGSSPHLLYGTDNGGRRQHFQGGSIYWHPSTGAHEVHGAIRDKWRSLGSVGSFLGYPLTDETGVPDGIGRFNHFEGGSVYWHPNTGAFEVHGAIRDKWARLGWETSFLGYPVSDELDAGDGRISYFEHGSIHWSPQSGISLSTPRTAMLIVHAIRCDSVASGFDTQTFDAVAQALQAVNGPVGGALSTTGPQGAAVAGVLATVTGLLSGLTDVLRILDLTFGDTDHLYVSRSAIAEEAQVWPAGDSQEDVQKGSVVLSPGIAVPFNDRTQLHFWDADRGFLSSNDDSLGVLDVSVSDVGGVRARVIGNPAEGSLYTIAYSIEML
jgi:hypothetical protein